MKSLQERQKRAFLKLVLFIVIFLIALSGFYVWYVIPSEDLVEIHGQQQHIEGGTFMGSIIDVE